REDDGGSPETERFAVARHTRVRLEGPTVKAGKAARERVLDVTAREVLLKQTDQKEADQPDRSVTENIAAKAQAAVDDEQACLPEGQDEQGKADDSPYESGEKARNLTAAAKAIDRVGTALDLRHDPGSKQDREEGDGFVEEHQLDGHVRGDLLDVWSMVWSMRVDPAGDPLCSEENNCEDSDEDEQAPASAESVPPDENLLENRRRSGCDRFGGDRCCAGIQRFVLIQWASSCFCLLKHQRVEV